MPRICLILLIVIPPFLPRNAMWLAVSFLAVFCLFLLGRLEKLEAASGQKNEREKQRASWTRVPAGKPEPATESPCPPYTSETVAREAVAEKKQEASAEEALLRQAPPEKASGMQGVSPVTERKIPGEEFFSSRVQEALPQKTVSPRFSPETFPEPHPTWDQMIAAKALNWLRNGNPLVKLGLVVLLFGISFLLRYAVERAWFPPELRFALAGILGIVLLCIGWGLREKKRTFALLLQGGGIATLYLTTFAAAKPDTFPIGLNMISSEWGLVIMTAIVIFSAILALVQNALWVAIFGWAGGFMAPILLSTGLNRYIALFSYYALLNAGLLGVAWFKSWPYLNRLGFFFTFGVGSFWGFRYYRPEFFTTTEPFLVLFFLMYATISILLARQKKNKKEEAGPDSVLVFGLPLLAFGLQMELVHGMEMGGAYSCLVLAAWYLGTATLLRKKSKVLKLLAESHIGLGIIFISLAVPMAFDATVTASTWALEGAGMVWLGLRQKHLFPRIFGILLQAGAAISFFIVLEGNGGKILETGQLLAGLFLALGGFVSSEAYWTYRKNLNARENFLPLACGIWGLLFWYASWTDWLICLKTSETHFYLLSVFTLSHLLWLGISRKRTWPVPGYALQGFLALLFLLALSWPVHPTATYGWIIWPLALGLHFFVLHLREKTWKSFIVERLHTGSALLLALLFMWEAWWLTKFHVSTGIWAHTAPAVTAGFILFVVSSRPKLLSWPIAAHEKAYMHSGAVLAIFLATWWLLACFRAGGQEPLPHVPVLNVLDLCQAMIIMLLAVWTLRAEKLGLFRIHALKRFFTAGLAAATFTWINVVVTRTAHFWGGIPYKSQALFASTGLQTIYSVLWTFMALIAMFYSHRRMRREFWFLGAVLLALVVAKLFLVDLSGRGTIAGIVSFLGVGILMLVVGYLCPLPPKPGENKNSETWQGEK